MLKEKQKNNNVVLTGPQIDTQQISFPGNVKLANGPSRCVGRVEYYDQGEWVTVCGEAWDVNDATVVCRQLDCGRVHKITSATEYGHGTGQTRIEQIECSGLESTLAQCPQRPFTSKTCNATSLAGVVCTGRGIFKIPRDNIVFFVVTEFYECNIFHHVCVVIFFVVS